MRIDVLGVGFDNMTMEQAVAEGMRLIDAEGAHYVVTPNPEIVETCREDAEAMEAVQSADLVIADGIGVIYGAKILGTPLKAKLPGIEFAQNAIEGTCSILILRENGNLIAARDRLGRIPVLIAKGEDRYCVSFESFDYQ